MMIYYGKYKYTLDKKIGSGGEGFIYDVHQGKGKYVAKVYNTEKKSQKDLSELSDKIVYMVKNKPDASVLEQIAWPIDVIRTSSGNFAGFLMPKVDFPDQRKLSEIYEYPPKNISLSYEHRLIIAINICRVLNAVHNAGYVIGDFNPQNIIISPQNGHVAFIDTDSYHVLDKDGAILYKCTVAARGYTAPELRKKVKIFGGYGKIPEEETPFTKETDYFALSIHIFRLLMNGCHPYFNKHKITQDSSAEEKAIEEGLYYFKSNDNTEEQRMPALESMPARIQNLFTKTFITGEFVPIERPTPAEWEDALLEYKSELVQCSKVPAHYYHKKNKACPYCAADKRYSRRTNIISDLEIKEENSLQLSYTKPENYNQPQKQVNNTNKTAKSSGGSSKIVNFPAKKTTIYASTAILVAGVLFGALFMANKDISGKEVKRQQESTQRRITRVSEVPNDVLNALVEQADKNMETALSTTTDEYLLSGATVVALVEKITNENPYFEKFHVVGSGTDRYFNKKEYSLNSISLFIPKKRDEHKGLIKLNYAINIDFLWSDDNRPDDYKRFSGPIYVSYIWHIDTNDAEELINRPTDYKLDYSNADYNYNAWYEKNILSKSDKYYIDELQLIELSR